MKPTGLVRTLDDLGRLVVPKEIRRTLGLDRGTPMEVFTEDDKIIFRKYAPGCSCCCTESKDLVGWRSVNLCHNCISIFYDLANDADDWDDVEEGEED